MENSYYFTFGTSECYPFHLGYVIVKAGTLKEAIGKFRKEYPDKHENTVNCAFWYTQEEWGGTTMGKTETLHRVIE